MIDSECRRVFVSLGLRMLVETGTDRGETVAEVARWLAALDPGFGRIIGERVTGARAYSASSPRIRYPVFAAAGESRFRIYSVDVDRASVEEARELFRTNPHIRIVRGDSADFLRRGIDDGSFTGPEAMFYLDAHWGKYWPLRDELQQIRRLERFVVVIDDFFVPGKSDPDAPRGPFGFDIYDGVILNWGHIADIFSGRPVAIYYPVRPNRDGRGYALLIGGSTEAELASLADLPFFRLAPDDPAHRSRRRAGLRACCSWRSLVRAALPLSWTRMALRTYQRLTS